MTDERSSHEACAACLAAVQEANLQLEEWNAPRVSRGLPSLEHGFGLHVGTAEYGNIGSRSRLDFTVIGRDVNKASRVEGMCSKIGRRIVASAEFTSSVGDAHWESLGVHSLKGVSGSHELFGLAD